MRESSPGGNERGDQDKPRRSLSNTCCREESSLDTRSLVSGMLVEVESNWRR